MPEYGYQHQKLRAQYAVVVDAGDGYCWRCATHITPGQAWHLGHDDDDRTVYRGIECVPCNLSAAGRKRQQMQPKPGLRAPIVRRQRSCPICGTGFKASYREQTTCSRACGVELRRRNQPAIPIPLGPVTHHKTCTECGLTFTTPSNRKVTCSIGCSKRRAGRKSREYYHTNETYREATKARSREAWRSRTW
jgi:hypothetical protein